MSGLGAPILHRVPALDGLRAIAVTGVLLFHAGVAAVPGGFLGVDVFFVLSGYLITSLILAEHAATGRISLARFWGRRARRLLPAVVVLVAVCVLVSLLLPADEASSNRSDAFASLLYFNNWHQIFTEQSYFVAAGRPSLLRHLWSLSVEEQFYLLWPLILTAGLAAWKRIRLVQGIFLFAVASAVLMAVLYSPTKDPSRVYYGTDTRATTLLVGAGLAFVWPMRPTRGKPNPRAALVLDVVAIAGLAGILAAFLGAHEYDTWIYRGGLTLISIASGLLIAAVVHPSCRVAKALGTRPFVWVGERSYGIYLWHWPIMALTRPQIDVRMSLWVLVPLQIGLTVLIAALSFRYVEMPFRTGAAQKAIRAWMERRAPRRRLGIVSGTAAATVLCFVWLASGSSGSQSTRATNTPAAAAVPKQQTTPAGRPVSARGPVLAIGASVMLGAKDALEQRLGKRTIVDAAVGRWPHDIAERLEAYRQQKAMPARVVIQMGENGPIREEDIKRIEQALQGTKRVVLVNVHVPRSWEDDVNNTLLAIRGEIPHSVVADWNSAAKPALLYGDGIHPNPAGQQVYARVVQQALRAPE